MMTKPSRHRLLASLGFCLLWSGCESPDPLPEVHEVVLHEVATIGVLEGDERQEFGLVLDVRALSDSSFLVLDYMAPAVGWFSPQGEYLGGIRNQGEGPGELLGPHAFEMAPPGQLVVADRQNDRLNRYQLGESGFRADGSVRGNWFGFPAERSICALGDRYFVHDVRAGSLLHEVDEAWEPLRSFGPVAPLPHEDMAVFEELVLQVLNRGRLECLDSPPMLLWISENLPSVRAFTPDGEQVWETEVSGVRPREVVLRPGPGLEPDPIDGSHQGYSIVRWSDDTVLVQYRFWPPDEEAEEGDPVRIDSRFLSLSTGEEVGRNEDLPRIVAVSGDLLYALEEEPYPHVVLWRR